MGDGPAADSDKRSFGAILDGAVILDGATGRILQANNAAATILSFASPEEMVGQNPLDYVPDEDRQPVTVLLAQGLETDRPTPAEIRVKTKDGRLVWLSVTSALIEHEGKKAALLSIRELTSEKAKEAALKEAEQTYRRLFETMLDGAVVLDTATSRVILANQAAAIMFGFVSPEEMVSENPLDYVPREDQERVVRLVADSIERGYLPSTEIKIRGKDGRLLWVSVSASLIEHGGKKATLATIRDITSDREKEAALTEAERRYERLFDGMLDGAVVLNISTFEIVLANRAAAEMFGFESPREVIGENPLSYVPEEARDDVARMIALNLEGKGPNPVELKVLTRDKREIWASVTATKVDYEGRTATLATLRDITADKLKDAALRAAEESRLRLMDAASEAITIVHDGKLVYVNPAVVKGAGIPREQLIGLAFLDLVHPDERRAVWERYERILAGEWPSEIATMRGVNVKGETLWAEIREIPFTWQGRPAVMSLIHDITEKVKAEESLKASEERFRTLIERATDVVIVLDATGKITYQSPSLERVTGFGHDEWVGRPLDQLLIHPDDLPSLVSLLERVLKQPGASFGGITARYQHKDGSWHTLEATVTNMLHDPKVNGLVANFRDITERKRMEDALRTSEERSRLLVENASEVIAVIQDGLLKLINPKVTDFIGYLPEELVSRSFAELVYPDDRQMVADNYAKRLSGEQLPNNYQFRVTHKNGDVRWAEISVALFEWEGRPATLALLNDITERKQAEGSLREAKEHAENIIKTANVLVVMLDTEGKVTLLNEAGERITGYRQSELLGKNWFEVVAPKERYPKVWEAFGRVKDSATIVDTFENPILTKSGEERVISWKNSTLVANDKVIGTLSFGTDITERKTAEEALKQSEAKYKRLFESTQTAMEVINMETGLVALANEATARMFGFASAEDLVGEDSTRYLRPEDVPWVTAKMAQAVADNSWREIQELQVQTKDGRWLWISGMVIQTEYQGKPALLVSLLDITSRKQAEETLRESEEKYRLLTEKTNDVIYATDLDFNNTYISPSVERILGFTPEEYLGRSPDQRMTLDSLARAQEALLEHLSLEKDPNADPNRTVRIELEFYRKDGSTVWLEHQVSGLRDANGTAIGLHGVARDVTERRKAEQTLKDSEAIYKRLFENTQTAMEVISGETGLVVLANETTAKMFGFDSADDLIGLDSMQYLLPEDRDRVATQMAQALADKTWSQGTELRVMTKDGRLLWINGLVTNTEYQGKPALLVSLIDLTARKQAEETLRSSEEKYRFLAEKTDDIIWTADLNLRTTYVSPSVQRVLGFTPEERLTQDPAHQMTPESITKAAEALAQHLALERDPKANPNRALRIELEYYRKDGSTVWLENQVTGIRDANGSLIGFHGVARDISERRRTERALRESEEKYRLLTENTNDMIWVAEIRDMNLRPTYVSSSVERILGFTPEEHLKRDLSQVIAPESLDRVMEALLAQLALEQDPEADPNRTATIEVQYNRRDGSTVWMENLISGIRDDNGTLVGLHGVARDVSDRKRVEKALNERLKELQCIASISRLAERPELPIEDFVREAVSLLPPAWQYPEICGARIMLDSKEFKTADYRETQWSQSADIRVDEKRFGTVMVCYLKEMPEADEGPFLKEERDLINTVADFLGHVIQHRQMEQSLRASEERYRLLIDNAAEAIAVIQDGLVNFVNPKGAELVGRAGERMTPTPFLDYIHPDDRQMMIENHAKRLAGQEAPNNYTFRILDKEGNTRHIQINAVTLEWEGRPAVLAMLNDITDRVKVQEALIASERDYKNLFEQTMLGMEVIDGQTGKVLLANHAIARMFGFESPEEMVGLDGVTGWVMPEDMEWVLRGFAEAMADPEKRDVATLRIKGKDGRIVWVSGSGTLFDYEGRPAILISLVNVTAAKEAESKLHESEEKNRLLIDNAAEGIAVIQDGVAKFFNRRLVELTGWTAEELLTRSFLDLVHPDEREMIALNYMRRVAGDDVPNNYQFRIIDREGNTKWLQISAVQFNWEGKPATLDMFSEVTEQVKAEQALRDSEERFRSLVEKATDAVAVVDTAGNILYYTPSMERVTGYKPGEWISKSLSDLLLHRDDLPKLASVLEQVLKEPGAAVENFTTRYQHPDGTWHVLEATARNMLHDPKIGGVVANFRDITERVKAEQALKESEERYRLLADNSSDVIWVVDVNLKFTYVSPAVTRLLGYTVEEATAGSFIDRALTPDSLLSMTQALTEDLAGEERRPGSWRERVVEMEVVSKDGSKFWLEAAISGIRDSDGRLVGFQGACRNITDRKEAEELLRASEERFRGLVETTSDWVWEIDRNSRYTYVSPRVRDILGREPEEVLGHTPFEFMHQREGRRVSKIVRRFAAEHLPFSLLENTCVHKDGHAVVMETSAVPIIGSDGSFLGYRGIDRDITERKKAEQELQRSLKRLEKTMESTIEAITTTIETRDPYTTGHQMRVTELACAIAKVMEIPPTQIEGIRVAGLLHDIGKIAIPTEILSKPGKLNEVEYEMIKTHSKVGYNILKKIEFPWPVARAVLQHHERWNGSGYPHGIRGDDILLEARILAVADVMEAMSSHRPYRPSIGADKALDEISKNSGILYDPAVAQACITAFTQAGFKFAPSLPGVAADLEGTSASHPVQYLEDS